MGDNIDISENKDGDTVTSLQEGVQIEKITVQSSVINSNETTVPKNKICEWIKRNCIYTAITFLSLPFFTQFLIDIINSSEKLQSNKSITLIGWMSISSFIGFFIGFFLLFRYFGLLMEQNGFLGQIGFVGNLTLLLGLTIPVVIFGFKREMLFYIIGIIMIYILWAIIIFFGSKYFGEFLFKSREDFLNLKKEDRFSIGVAIITFLIGLLLGK